MTRTTQTTIRNLIKAGAAKELVNTTSVSPYELTQIAYSAGLYGINGALLKHCTTGELYAIVGRSAALFYYC